MINSTNRIEVVEYNSYWPKEFQMYEATLKTVLGGLAMSIEHIGSTSVVGLAAKPIIDIDVVISSRLVLGEVIEKLASIDYVHQGNRGIIGREAFVNPKAKQHHLYVCSIDTPNLHNHLIFRDYLRTHYDVVEAYSQLKQRLAIQCQDNRDQYTELKSEFIQNVLAKAKSQYGFNTFQP